MPRAIWKGSISFGLVNAPVAMYAAISEQDLHFHLVHTKDMAGIGYQKVCKREDKPVPDDEIARAFDLDGKLVIMEDEDFEAARAEGYHAITVQDFVPLEQIDPVYFERTFYLAPAEDGAGHVYALLAKAMDDAGLAAICSYIFHQREQLGCLRSRDGVLLLEKLYFADEVRPHEEHRPAGERVARQELEMARDLIDRMAGDFDVAKYRDTYRDALMRVIRKKAKGQKVTAPAAPEREHAPDLMSALQASLEAASGRRAAARSAKGGDPPSAGGPRGPGRRAGGGGRRNGELADLSVEELRKRAAKAGVEGRSKMTRRQLEQALG
jgi:DNA end-binding protein Ku